MKGRKSVVQVDLMVIIEVQMTEVGTEYVVKSILTTHKSGAPILPKGEFGTGINPDMEFVRMCFAQFGATWKI